VVIGLLVTRHALIIHDRPVEATQLPHHRPDRVENSYRKVHNVGAGSSVCSETSRYHRQRRQATAPGDRPSHPIRNGASGSGRQRGGCLQVAHATLRMALITWTEVWAYHVHLRSWARPFAHKLAWLRAGTIASTAFASGPRARGSRRNTRDIRGLFTTATSAAWNPRKASSEGTPRSQRCLPTWATFAMRARTTRIS